MEDGHLGGKFQVRRYITFAIARWNLCASTTFEILPLSICTLSQQKSYISKGVQPIFEIFASARIEDVDGGHMFGKFHRCADTVLLQWQGENFAHVQHLKYPTFNLYTVAAKILYLQRYSTDFRNLNLSWKMLRVGISVESFKRADILLLQWQGENFAHWQHLETSPLSTCTHVPAKILYLQRYSTDFRNLCRSSKMLRWALVQSYRCADIYFYNGKVKTLRIDNIWNFANFKLYTVPAKILYLHRYSTDFQNVWHSSKILRVGIWVERFKRAGILLLQWQGENLCACTTFEISHFQPVHCPSKNPISPKVFNRFSKSLPQLEDFVGGQLGGKFQVRRYGTFAMARRNFAHVQQLKFPTFNLHACASKNPTHVSPKVFNRFSKS